MDFLNEYNILINELKKIFPKDNIFNNIDIDNNIIINNCLLFNNLINDNFDLFLNCKIKIFSHKNDNTLKLSTSLFGTDLFIKDLLNNQSDYIKKKIWDLLHKLYISIEKSKNINDINQDNIDKINNYDKIHQNNLYNKLNKNEATDHLYKILDINTNDDTSNMIDDIINSFDNIINNNSENPFNNIMDISKQISEKYSDKINGGDIKIDNLMSTIMNKIPNLIPNNSSESNSDNPIPNEIFDIMNQLSDITKNIIPNINGSTQTKETQIMDDTFSTANVELGKIKESSNSMKIGNILKIADQFGVIPGGKNQDSNITQPSENNNKDPNIFNNFKNILSPNSNNETHNMPDMNNIFDMFKNIIPSDINNENQNGDPHSKIQDINKMLSLLQKITNNEQAHVT